MTEMILYDYWRSSAAYRVRIALNLKGLDYQAVSVHLVKQGGEQKLPAYKEINPQGLVPSLKSGNLTLTQSLAIIDWLDEVHPQPALLPQDPADRAYVRSLALAVACDIHPLNNLRVMNWLKTNTQMSDELYMQWYRHWIQEGFEAFEKQLLTSGLSGQCCYGDSPGLADLLLIPQVYNAERFNCPLDTYPQIRKIVAYCRTLPAFTRALPENQLDAVPG